MHNTVFVFTRKKILGFDPATKKTMVAISIPETFYIYNYSFIVKSPNGKIYAGANGLVYGEDLESPIIFEIDPISKKITFLPRHPANLVKILSAYVTEKYLYCDGGFVHDHSEGYLEKPERWRFNILENTWEKLQTPSISYDGTISTLISFRYKNQLFRFGKDPETFMSSLYSFDPNSESWQKVREFENLENLDANEVPIIGNKAFFRSVVDLVEMNLDDYSFRSVNMWPSSSNLINPVVIGSKIYSTNFNRVYETDPAFFKYD